MVGILFLVWSLLLLVTGVYGGAYRENDRIYQKCLVEFQDSPHKQAIELCSQRVKHV